MLLFYPQIYTNRNCSSVNCLCKLNIALVYSFSRVFVVSKREDFKCRILCNFTDRSRGLMVDWGCFNIDPEIFNAKSRRSPDRLLIVIFLLKVTIYAAIIGKRVLVRERDFD